MADTGKSVRVARTQFGGGLAQAGRPTEKSQLVGQEVHQYRDTESDALYQLNDAIGRFMGAGVNALTSVQEGYQRGKLAEIEQGNKAQKAQALGDALAGKEMDPALAGDNDYYDAFRTVKAQRDGFEAAQDFTSWYMSEWLPDNPMGDLAAARQQWALENITGSDDPEYEGQLIASFFDRTDGLLPEHMKAALKYQTDKGVEALGALVEADVATGSVTPDKLNDYFNKMRTLDPLNANEAPTRVVNTLLAAAANHPDKMMGISKMLSAPGTGVNGKSFQQSFPEAYAQFQQQAVSAFNEINSTKELEAFTGLEDRIRSAKTPDELTAITVDLFKARQQFGAPGKVNQLLGQVDTALTQMGKNMDLVASTMAWVGGDHSVSVDDVKKGFPLMLEQMGLKSILDPEPKKAAQIIASLGGVQVDQVGPVLTASILDTRNPEAQAKALETLNILASQAGEDVAKSYLNDAAKNMFDHAHALAKVTNEPMDALLGRINESRDKIKDWDASWQTITKAENAKDADKRVNDVATKALNDALGKFGNKGINVPLTLNGTVLDAARIKALEFEASGLGWEAGVRDAMDGIVANADLLPVANGKFNLVPNASTTSMYVSDNVGTKLNYLMDSTYSPQATELRPKMGTAVINPTTSKPVDTIQVFRDQTRELAQTMPALFPGGKADNVFLSTTFNPDMKARGLFEVRGQNDRALVFAAGQKIKVTADQTTPAMTVGAMGVIASVPVAKPTDDREFLIPETAKEMGELFDLPEGFKFVRVDTPGGVTWHLGYRPNFGNETGKTLDQKAAGFTAPAPNPEVGVTLGNWKLPQIDIGLIKNRN